MKPYVIVVRRTPSYSAELYALDGASRASLRFVGGIRLHHLLHPHAIEEFNVDPAFAQEWKHLLAGFDIECAENAKADEIVAAAMAILKGLARGFDILFEAVAKTI